jgi:hypothetical protein
MTERIPGLVEKYPDLQLVIEEDGQKRIVAFRDPRRAFAVSYCADNCGASAYPLATHPISRATRFASSSRASEYN